MKTSRIIEKLKEKTFKRESIPMPKDKEHFIPTDNLSLEIGCGVGMHSIQYSQDNPLTTLVALEHTQERFLKFNRRFKNHNSPANLIPKHENAISWITHKLPKQSVDHIYILYPNPFPKAKDSNKRWFCMPFFTQLLYVLKRGGKITLATNEEFYFNEAVTVNKELWKLTVIEARPFSTRIKARTHFEKKYLERKQTCYNLVLQKNQ